MTKVLDQPSIVLHGISTVAGRYLIGEESIHPGVNLFACRLRMIGSDALRVTAPVIPELGEAVMTSLANFGVLRGVVTRQLADGFELSLIQSHDQRSALNTKIASFSETLWTPNQDRRSSERRLPANPRTVISRPDDWAQPCLIVDYSEHGAAVSAAFQPAVGEVVTIGQITGVVVRRFDLGFAVEFFEPQQPDQVEQQLEAPEEWRNAMLRAFPSL